MKSARKVIERYIKLGLEEWEHSDGVMKRTDKEGNNKSQFVHQYVKEKLFDNYAWVGGVTTLINLEETFGEENIS